MAPQIKILNIGTRTKVVLPLALIVAAFGTTGTAQAATPMCDGHHATIVGTDGSNTIVGTSGPDVIVAKGGNDTIRGRGGNDIICAGRGADHVHGGKGSPAPVQLPGKDHLPMG